MRERGELQRGESTRVRLHKRAVLQRQDQVKYFEALVCGSDMVTEQTRNYVWQELLDAARLVRYYEALSDRHRRNHSRVRFLLLAAATGSIAALLDLIPEITQLFTSAGVALLVAWDFVSDYAKKAAVLHMISLECSALEIEFQGLWLETDNPKTSDNEIRSKGKQLERRMLEVTGWAGNVDVREDSKLNEKCEVIANQIMVDKYAG